eukprot:7068362-Pyramimonas_sp.AAC.2
MVMKCAHAHRLITRSVLSERRSAATANALARRTSPAAVLPPPPPLVTHSLTHLLTHSPSLVRLDLVVSRSVLIKADEAGLPPVLVETLGYTSRTVRTPPASSSRWKPPQLGEFTNLIGEFAINLI